VPDSAHLHLLAQTATGAAIYCAVLFALDSGRIFRMRDAVLKRGVVSA
jgi:hypothetical protein